MDTATDSYNPIPRLRTMVAIRLIEAMRSTAVAIPDEVDPVEVLQAVTVEGGASIPYLTNLLQFLHMEDDPDQFWSRFGLDVIDDIVWLGQNGPVHAEKISPLDGREDLYIIHGALAVDLRHPEVRLDVRGAYLAHQLPSNMQLLGQKEEDDG